MNPAKYVLTKTGVMDVVRKTKCFDQYFNTINITTLDGGRCTAELKIEEQHTNLMGTLHGGLSTTLVDCISGYALVSKKDCAVPSVSVNINVNFIGSAAIGDVILVDANIVKVGKTMAFLDVTITNKETGAILVSGSHIKYLKRPS